MYVEIVSKLLVQSQSYVNGASYCTSDHRVVADTQEPAN